MQRDGRTRRLSAKRFAAAAALGVTLIISFVGCASVPPPAATFPESLVLTDYSTWFAVDVADNRDLISWILNEVDSRIAGIVDRTDRIVGGVRLVPGSTAEISAVAAGAFPKGGVEFALGSGRGFERRSAQVDGRTRAYFAQTDGMLELAVPANDLLYVSSGRVLEMLADRPPAELELDASTYRTLRSVGLPGSPDAVILFNDPGVGLLGSLHVQNPSLPIDSIELSFTVRDDGLDLGGRLRMRSEREARLFGRVGRLFVVVFVRALGLSGADVQQSATIDVSGIDVTFSGIPMSREDLLGIVKKLSGAE